MWQCILFMWRNITEQMHIVIYVYNYSSVVIFFLLIIGTAHPCSLWTAVSTRGKKNYH